MATTDQEAPALRALAADLAREAGALLSAHRVGPLRIESKGSASDMVTDADRASEALIVEALSAARPQDGLLGEEGHARPSTSGLTWIIDPLDGTTNFIHGMPPHGVSIGVWRDLGGADEPVAGALYDITHDELFSAGAGCGATLNGRPIAREPAGDLRTAIVGTGFAHDPGISAAEAEVLTGLLPAIGDLRRVGAGAFDICWVALGRQDAFYQAGLKVWDYAAARLVALERGCDFRLLPGLARSGPTAVAAAAELADELAVRLTHCGVGRL